MIPYLRNDGRRGGGGKERRRKEDGKRANQI